MILSGQILIWSSALAVPYSFDLRTRVLKDVIGGSAIRTVASQFGVSPSFVSKLHKRYRRTGSVAPDKQGGDYRSHRIEAHGDWIMDTVAARPDITLMEMRGELGERGLGVSASTVWRFLDRHAMSFKKNGACRRAGTRGRSRRPHRLEEQPGDARPWPAGVC